MSTWQRARALAVAATSIGAIVVLVAHRPSLPATAAGDPTCLITGVTTCAAWGLTLYLLVGMTAAAATHLRWVPAALVPTPGVLRRLVDVAVGATAAATVVALSPVTASADTHPGPATTSAGQVVASPLDWPGLRAAKPPHVAAPDERVAVVRAGDSLWSITARRLGPDASPAAVAAAWPRVYAANRTVIGPNPDLIRPGQRLTLPPTTGGAP